MLCAPVSPRTLKLPIISMKRHYVCSSPGSGLEVEAEDRPDPVRPALPLQQVGLAGPGGGVVRHVVVRHEQLDLGLAAVNDEHHVHNGDAGLGDVGADDDLGDAGRHLLEHGALDLAVAQAPEHRVLLQAAVA